MKKNIILTGFMGAGKSVIAKKLGYILSRELISTDALIEIKENREIADIFRDSGEEYFRKVESEVIDQVSSKEEQIIDCGGGVVLSHANMDNLKKTGVVFYLSATPDVIYQRVKSQKHRPLLNVDNPQAKIRELLQTRQQFYCKADYTIDTSQKTIDQVAQDILELMRDD